ncbi:MAG: 3-hydroxyacyl-CoA dehydrogenase NAD-binding domain-containing protein, partial [Nannocystaceae bacterium]
MNLHRPPHQLVATVIGAGTMGAQIAAHLANAGVRTHLLDIVPRDTAKDAPKPARDAVAAGALKLMLKGKPAPFMDKAFASRITVGNLDDDLESAVAVSDLVVEVVIERLDIKRPLFERIGKAAPEHAVLATNTSGLPIGDIVEGLPQGVARRVVGMHWFNPPRYMHLLEIVPSAHTDPAVAEALGTFSDRVLGKGVVVCRDTPN